MMELTAHQSSVGNVLQAGNQLITQGTLTDEEEFEIQEQMSLLNARWEALRVESMDRQSRWVEAQEWTLLQDGAQLFSFKNFLKVFIEFVTILLLLFMFWFFVHKACGILAPWAGIEPLPSALEGEVLTTESPCCPL